MTSITYSTGIDTSTTTRTTGATTPVTIASSGSSTITLAIAEDAYLGDAQFTVSVDGTQIGGTQTATALHDDGQSQNFILDANLSAGTHTISVDFLNDAFGIYSTGVLAGDRNLYVDSITVNGVTTVENSYQNLPGTHNYIVTVGTTTAPPVTTAAPTISIASQTLAKDTGASATDDITSDGAVTLSGTVTGPSGTTVSILDEGKVLGAATITNGAWAFATTLGAGTHSLSAVATDSAGSTTAAAGKTIIVETTAPALTISAPVQTANTSTVSLSGTVGTSASSVEIFSGTSELGLANIANGAWSFGTSLAAGSYTLSATATDLAGNTTTATDPAFTVAGTTTVTPSITYATGIDTSTTTRTAGVTTPVTIASSGSSTITLAIAEDAYLGDAQFTVSVDGTQIGGTQTATALHDDGQSQNFTLDANLTTGTNTISVDFLNDAFGIYSTGVLAGDRNLYVDSITVNGTTTVENSYQNVAGTDNYLFTAAATTSPPVTTAAPSISITAQTLAKDTGASTTDGVTSDGAVTLSGTVTGPSGTTVSILDEGKVLGAATITNANWVFATTLGAGTHSLSAVATDTAGSATATAAQTIVVETTAPALTIATPVQTANTTTVSLSGTVGASASSITVFNGSTALGQASIANGAWSFATTLAAGSYTLSATATDLAGNTTTATDPAFTVTAPVTTSAPSISITSQVLAKDTGASATDNVTSDGAVTLSGTVSGPSGTTVSVLDAGKVLGAATITNGTWGFATTLGAGTHSLSAVATDTAGSTTATAAQNIIVETTAPALTMSAPVQTANTTTVDLTGTVGATATAVDVYSGSTALGAASISNGSWSFATSLAAGSYTLSATATDLAGNTATAADPAFTVTAPVTTPPPTTTPDILVATVSTGTGTAQQTVDLTSPTRLVGTYVASSTSGIGTNPLVTYNWNPSTQLASFLSAQAAGTASIVAIGDSWTSGFGASVAGWTELSYISETAQALQQDGIAAQTDNFLADPNYISNDEIDDNRVTLFGGASDPYVIVAGGTVIGFTAAGQGFDFSLDTPETYNQVTISYVDVGNGSVSLSLNGGPVVGTLNFGNTGQTMTQTLTIPATLVSQLTVTSANGNPSYIQGASFSSTTNHAITVENAGIGGWDSTGANTSVVDGSTVLGSGNGYGQTASTAALHPSLVIIDLGSNDIALAEDTTAQTVANITQMVATLRAAGSDVIVMIPQPFGSTYYATALPALRAGLQAMSLADNVPLIDLSATYDNSEADLEAAGLKSDLLHGDATFYADIGTQLAQLLTTTINNANTQVIPVTTPAATAAVLAVATQTVAGTAGNDTLTGTAANNTLVGNGGTDTYVVNATDQTDTIINGTAASTTPAGQLDIAGATHDQLWLEQSGNNLVVDVLGTDQKTIIQNWYGSPAAQLTSIAASDGYKLDSGIQALVQAMASFSAATPGFDPTTTSSNLTDGSFSAAVTTAATAAWHK